MNYDSRTMINYRINVKDKTFNRSHFGKNKTFSDCLIDMMTRTNKITETPVTGMTTSTKESLENKLEAQRRLIKILTGLFVGHVLFSIVAASTLGVYVNDHVRQCKFISTLN